MRHGWVAFVLLMLAVGAVPGAQAGFPYKGPGHQGLVPLGDGGHALGLPAELTDNRTEIVLTAIPADACRLVLDTNGTYAKAHAAWSPGDAEAILYADAGTIDAPFRVVSHWITDVNDECTAEVTTAGVLWHDARGRPFVELTVNETKSFWKGPVGSVFPLAVEITNNGTLNSTVTAKLPIAQAGWEIRDASPVLNVRVGPLKTVTFRFDVFVPASEKPRMNVLALELRADDWAARSMLFLDLQPAVPSPADAAEAKNATWAEPWEPTPREAPGPTSAAPLVVVALAALALRARRRVGQPPDAPVAASPTFPRKVSR